MVVNHIYATDAQMGSIAAYLVNLSLKELINTITTFDNRLSDKLRSKRTNFIYIRNIKRLTCFPGITIFRSTIFRKVMAIRYSLN